MNTHDSILMSLEPKSRRLPASITVVFLLTVRELQRMGKEPSRAFGMLLQPLIFLGVFGMGFKNNFLYTEAPVDYARFFYPGILGLVVLFSSIYATLTLVEDKTTGLFRMVVIGPGGQAAAVGGKVVATAILGFCQSLLFLPLMWVLGIPLSSLTLVLVIAYLFLGACVFAAIGVLFAWLSPSASAFHALMSVVLIPMWLLSGAMFPLPKGLVWLSFINPMSYLVQGLRALMLGLALSHWQTITILLTMLVLACLVLALAVTKRPLE